MHFHFIKSIFLVFPSLEAVSFTLDSTAARAEVAEGDHRITKTKDGCFVPVRMAVCLEAFFPLLYQVI